MPIGQVPRTLFFSFFTHLDDIRQRHCRSEYGDAAPQAALGKESSCAAASRWDVDRTSISHFTKSAGTASPVGRHGA